MFNYYNAKAAEELKYSTHVQIKLEALEIVFLKKVVNELIEYIRFYLLAAV